MKLRLLILTIFMVSLFSITGQTSLESFDQILSHAGFEENWEVRQEYKETIKAPFYSMMHAPAAYLDQVISSASVKFELRRGETAFYLLFLNEQKNDYPTLGRGNWIIKRDMRTGDFIQAKIFLQNDGDTFIRLFPGEGRSYMDVYLYGHQLYSRIPVALAFDELIFTPFSLILSLTENLIDWKQIFTDREYEEWTMIKDLRDVLEESAAHTAYVDDGAMNNLGEWVYIESGDAQKEDNPGVNCSGYLKWVADGFYSASPFAENELLSFDELTALPESWKREESSWDLNFDYRDPRFGLDWTRNIASLLRKSFTNLDTEYAQMDVDRVPFYEYKADVGYSSAELDTIMYLQAVNKPGKIYWGAVSAPYKPEGETVTIWQYYHTALFVPRFTLEGDFRCDVFQSGEWTTLEIFLDQYADSWIHLSISDGLRTFSAPPIP